MMKTQRFLAAMVAMIFSFNAEAAPDTQTAHDFQFTRITGENLPLSAYAGSVLLVVNTASECGFTKQYKDLQQLHTQYQDKGLVIIGVPANDFGGQEPGTNAEIQQFCEVNFGVTFPLTQKVAVRGENAHPFYKWAAASSGSKPRWNFHKYLINQQGHIVESYSSMTNPTSSTLRKKIEALLAE